MTIEKARQSAEIIEELTALVDELKADRDRLQAELTEEQKAHAETFKLLEEKNQDWMQSRKDFLDLQRKHDRE